MAGGNFMHRVLSYFVNELVVNGLANSPAFQRFAVKTSRRIDDISNLAAKKKQELAEQVKDLSKNIDVRCVHGNGDMNQFCNQRMIPLIK
ncbi:hypothetical protein DKX38_009494 [Salix brachista]|uniref:Uncharacterized protein n=1 Tax=Salix brachista TaxID=2182728 RepID=A0A5N5MD26_9ROSI|nr:hypothetical protein DKX38_009494 [Salix brachista]